ncbi:MAG: hypothetical protein AAFO63_10615 [Pseudomonadota bacterium]
MKFKRPRLSAKRQLVNAAPSICLLFFAASCGETPTPSVQPDDTPIVSETTPADGTLAFPAVWNTSALDAEPTSVGVAGGLSSLIAISDVTGALQILDFQAKRITEPTELGVRQIGDGHYARLSGVAVSLFPGIAEGGDLRVYIHGGELTEPIEYAFDVEQDGPAAGLCTAAPARDSDGVLRLGFWTETAPQTLHSGRIVPINDQLIFLADEPVDAIAPITSCILEETGVTVFAEPIRAAARLSRLGTAHTVTLDSSGNLAHLQSALESKPISIRDGLSVFMPPLPLDLGATGDARGGGYPGGVIVVVGEARDGYRAVLIDPSSLTLDPLRP